MPETLSFPKLFTPGSIGSLTVKNRIVMAPMSIGFATRDHHFSQKDIAYYAARARGGAGLIITESVLVEREISLIPEDAPVIICDSDETIPSMKELTDEVHICGGKIAVQISPGQGRQSYVATERQIPAAPSAIPSFTNPRILCRELGAAEIKKLTEACGNAALRAKIAGFDMVEIHAHTGYLIDQFMTPLWNQRVDEYGGDFEGRMRFAAEIIYAIRERVGRETPICFRLSAEHKIDGGRTLQESLEIAQYLETLGIDILHIDAGCYDANTWMNPPDYYGEGCFVDLAAEIKKAVHIPVITVGNIKDPESAERILAAGQADFIGLGRSLIADPEWPVKAKKGRLEDIRPCLVCNEYCIGKVPAACSVNPIVGRERDLVLSQTPEPKKVMVVGGGPAGMEAARVSALRGHRVTLYEKGEELGGQLIAASKPNFKLPLARFIRHLSSQLQGAGVEVRFGQEVTSGLVETVRPDVVIIATGATPMLPLIPGIENEKNLPVIELHLGKKVVGDTVLIAGGGVKGCEAALELARLGKKVTIIEKLPAAALDVNPVTRKALLQKLEEAGVRILAGLTIKGFSDEGIIAAEQDGQLRSFQADTVVLALGVKSKKDLERRLKGITAELYSVGDCISPRKVGDAIHEGFAVGSQV